MSHLEGKERRKYAKEKLVKLGAEAEKKPTMPYKMRKGIEKSNRAYAQKTKKEVIYFFWNLFWFFLKILIFFNECSLLNLECL